MNEKINADTLSEAKKILDSSGPAAMYAFLSAYGLKYAILANGVARSDSIAGDVALAFIRVSASEAGKQIVEADIALTDLGASLDEVVAVAKVAGAHDFILELPQGYDTPVGEHGTSLSGGQRQRLAIARALLSNPRLLILDEATSALDFESERVIQQNMKAIGAGRTVIVIAHRLNTVREADRIVVLEQGRVVEQGTHDTLVGLEAGVYARLLKAQQQ